MIFFLDFSGFFQKILFLQYPVHLHKTRLFYTIKIIIIILNRCLQTHNGKCRKAIRTAPAGMFYYCFSIENGTEIDGFDHEKWKRKSYEGRLAVSS